MSSAYADDVIAGAAASTEVTAESVTITISAAGLLITSDVPIEVVIVADAVGTVVRAHAVAAPPEPASKRFELSEYKAPGTRLAPYESDGDQW